MNNNMNVGVITGGNNNFNQKNVYNNGGKKQDGDPGAGVAALVAVAAAAVALAVSFLKNYEPIFFWLKLLVITGGALHLFVLFSQAFDASYRYRDSMAPAGGTILATLLVWLTYTTFNSLPSEVLAVAAQPTSAQHYFQQVMEIWSRFNNNRQRIIFDNLTSALFLMMSASFNLAFGVQQLIESVGRAKQISALTKLAHWLRFFKTGGVLAAAVAALGAYLAISGALSGHLS